MTDLMPVIFFGHGNPMNTLLNNDYTIMAFRPIITSPCLNNPLFSTRSRLIP